MVSALEALHDQAGAMAQALRLWGTVALCLQADNRRDRPASPLLPLSGADPEGKTLPINPSFSLVPRDAADEAAPLPLGQLYTAQQLLECWRCLRFAALPASRQA